MLQKPLVPSTIHKLFLHQILFISSLWLDYCIPMCFFVHILIPIQTKKNHCADRRTTCWTVQQRPIMMLVRRTPDGQLTMHQVQYGYGVSSSKILQKNPTNINEKIKAGLSFVKEATTTCLEIVGHKKVTYHNLVRHKIKCP